MTRSKWVNFKPRGILMFSQLTTTIDIFCDEITSPLISDFHFDSRVIGGFQQLYVSKFSEFLFPSLVVEKVCKTNLRNDCCGEEGREQEFIIFKSSSFGSRPVNLEHRRFSNRSALKAKAASASSQ